MQGDAAAQISVFTDSIDSPGYNPGDYTVQVRAFTVDNTDTGFLEELYISVVDPCITADWTIDDTVFLSSSVASLVQIIG